MYTTVTKVRQDAGFVGNSNISDSFIASKIVKAQGIINSRLSVAYILPLPKYYARPIVFSGTGSGTGTMTITIGGESFVLAITSGMTAAAAADLLRTAALDSEVVVQDGIGNGATVTLYSLEGDDVTQLTITTTDPQTVAGITATAGTTVEQAVPVIEALATDIAVAYLFITEYGKEGQDTDKDGFRRLAMAKAALKDIAEGTDQIYDFAEEELPRSARSVIKFYPTTASQTDLDHPTENRLRIDRKY